MKSVIMALALVLATQNALAGDGGFALKTCVSESGRTNLTVFTNHASDAEVPVKVVFGIDGQFEFYGPRVNECEDEKGNAIGDDCLNVWNGTKNLLVNMSEHYFLNVDFPTAKTATLNPGFVDPRPWMKDQEPVGTIYLTCKNFLQEP